ncbi:MAG: phage tail protein [Methylovulum sp.]|nr:phage tail protein [Methylovulum sp.]
MGGSSPASKQAPAIGSFKVMSQGYGVTGPVVMGTARVQCILIDYADFYSVTHHESMGGKGGGGNQGTVNYSYYATVVLLVCEGVGVGVNYKRLWVNKDLYNTPDLKGFAEFDGADGQAAWDYMATKHPEKALVYGGFAYLAAHDYELTSSASIGNHGIEVEGFYANVGTGKDATIANCMTGLLLDDVWGVGFGVDRLLSLAQLDDYCGSYGLVISPALTEQEAAKDVLSRWATIANCGAVWTQNAAGDGGALKFIPVSQTAHSGNGTDYLPTAPLDITLTGDDFLAESGEEPVMSTPKDRAEADNSFIVEFEARSKEYNKMLTPAATDTAAIKTYGLREASQFVAKEIRLMDVAQRVCQNLLQQAQYGGGTHEARLSSWQYAYLEPGDVVFLDDAELGFDNWPVMIIEVTDDGDAMSIIFEDVPNGVGDSEHYAADDVSYARVPWNTPVGSDEFHRIALQVFIQEYNLTRFS